MDRFTRNYVIVLGGIVLLGAGWWLSSLDFRAMALNRMLAGDPLVAGYVYRFKVREVSNGVAQMYSPRSAEMPAVRFLGIARPELARLAPDNPKLVEAQQELARVQAHAAAIITAEQDIERVRWVLDRGWFESRGVVP